MEAPWRAVKSAGIHTIHRQCGRLLGGVKGREWSLTLECGHRTERRLRVPDGPESFQVRLYDRAKAPERVRCKDCEYAERRDAER